MSSGGALTSQKATDDGDKAGAAKAEEEEPDDTGDPDDIEAEPDTDPPPAQTSKRTKSDDVPVAKRSTNRPVTKPAATARDRPTAPAPTARSVVSSIAKAVDITPASGVPAQRTSLTEPTTFQTQSSLTTAQDTAPAITAAPSAPAAKSVATTLLSAFGIGPSPANIPGAPAMPVVPALLAYAARREVEQSFAAKSASTSSTPVAAKALTGAPTAAVAAAPDRATTWTVTPVAVSGNTDFIENLTGPGRLNDTETRFGIGGTDVGIMWDNGIPDNPATPDVNEHQVLVAFGDTFRDDIPVRTTGWRMNTLFRSWDNTLSNGMYVRDGIPHDPGSYSGSPMSNPNYSREIIGKPGYAVGPEVTIIPTAAISVPYNNAYGTRQYIQFMSVRSWDTPGQWTTNYSGIAYSDDNGQNWRSELVPASSIRTAAAGRSTVPFVSGNQNFQQGAFLKPAPGSPEAAQGWVYSYGTPAGRTGTAYLSRVKQDQILDTTKYQYWNGSTWVANKPSAATPILPGTTTSFFGFFKRTTYPSVGEMSVQYNEYEKKYIMLYTDQNNNVVMRKADTPQGTWSAPTTLVTSAKMPGLYAPMIHPWSSTTNVPENERQYLYWNLSTWDDYQVKTMRTDLGKV